MASIPIQDNLTPSENKKSKAISSNPKQEKNRKKSNSNLLNLKEHTFGASEWWSSLRMRATLLTTNTKSVFLDVDKLKEEKKKG